MVLPINQRYCDMVEKTTTEMVLVPGGKFLMGSPEWVLDWLEDEEQAFGREWFTDETPQIEVTVAPFLIDKYPVTVQQFADFVRNTGYVTDAEQRGFGVVYTSRYWEEVPGACWSAPGGPETSIEMCLDHPVVHISWRDAVAYSQWANKRLPTESEWELAARGFEYRLWPWGNKWENSRANSAEYWVGKYPLKQLSSWRESWLQICNQYGPFPQTTKVGLFEKRGETVFGVSDMAGNVYEWTASLCQLFGDRQLYDTMYQIAEGNYRVIRGGSWMNFRYQIRCSERIYGDPNGWSNFALGFRCARTI